MEREAFRLRMQNLKSYRELNPGKGYWDFKAYLLGGETGDPEKIWIGTTTYDHYGNVQHNIAASLNGDTLELGLPDIVITPRNNLDLAVAINRGRDKIGRAGYEILSMVTPIGDMESVYDIGKDITTRNYGQAALDAGLMLLPKFIKKPLKRIARLLKKNKKVIRELQLDDVKNWTDSDWDFNYDLAIKNRDKDKVLRIRDLHFMSKVPNNNISIRDGKPTAWFHGSPYAGHSTFNSSVFNNTIGGESALGREKGNFFTTDLNAAKNYATRPSAKSEFLEYTKPKNVKEKILNILGLYEPRYIHPTDRIPEDLLIDVKNMHNYEVSPLELMDMSNPGNKVYQSNKIYPVYINPGKTYTVDFEGNPWSRSPVEFPSKYYSREEYPDVDLVQTKNYPEGHFVEKRTTSGLTKDLDELKLELNSLDLPYNNVYYDGSGNESLYGKYRGWDSKLEPKNLISEYPDYRTRPGYSYSIFEHKYPNTTNGAVLYGASENFNTIHITNVVDANTGHYENYPIEDLVPLSSNLIKLATPITYDSSGKIIPISKRDIFTNSDIRYSEGGEIGDDKKQSHSEIPIINFDPKGDPYNPTYGYNPGAGYVSNSDPLGSLYVEGALLNPVFKLAGNAVSNVARGLTKYSSKYVPEVKRTVLDKINSLFRREAEDKARTFKLYDDAIESRNRIIEDLYSNPAYMERARQILNTYGDNYAQVYEDIINLYNTNYWNLPNPVIKQLDAKAKMLAKDAAVNRYITRRQPAGYDDFEYLINRNLTEIDYPTTRHELGHYVDFNLAKSSNPDYSNSMFAELKRDLSKLKNPLFPDKTDYYSKGTELKSYMNTLREYMFKNGMINNIGDKVTSRLIKKAIRSLPKDMRSIEAAYLQFATPGLYTKWFNKIPLLGTYPIVNKQFLNYEEDKDKARELR